MDINQTLTALQFQDRVTQILQNINKGINQVSVNIEETVMQFTPGNRQEPIDANNWLDNLKLNYTTSEERQHHSDVTGTGSGQNSAARDGDDTYFF